MDRKLVFSKNGNIYLDTYMTQSAFSKSRLSMRLTENGVLATKNGTGWTFSNWFFTGTKMEEQGAMLLEGAGFSGLTLKDFFDTQDNTRQYFASALVCSAIESAIQQKVGLTAIGAGGIIISSEFERIIFLPSDLYETASQCAGKEIYAQSEGMYINKTLKSDAALHFTQSVIAYRALTKEMPFSQIDQELREEDYKDHNFIPLSQKIWSLDQNLAQSVDNALKASSEKFKDLKNFPVAELFKELGITEDGNTTPVIRKTNISNEKFEKDSLKKQKNFQQMLKIKRWIRHNRTGLAIAGVAIAIAVGITGVFMQGNLQQPTTKSLTAFETVEMFYSAVNNLDSTATRASSKCKSANNITNMLSNIYVASKTRNAYNFKDKTVSPAEWFNFNYDGSYTMYGLSQFSIGTEKGNLFFEAPAKKTFPKSVKLTDPDIKNKEQVTFTVSYNLVYNEGYDVLFIEEKEDKVILTFNKDRWIITDIQQTDIKSSHIGYKDFAEEYKTVLESEDKNILKTAKTLRERYNWIPSNSELLEAEIKIKEEKGIQ